MSCHKIREPQAPLINYLALLPHIVLVSLLHTFCTNFCCYHCQPQSCHGPSATTTAISHIHISTITASLLFASSSPSNPHPSVWMMSAQPTDLPCQVSLVCILTLPSSTPCQQPLPSLDKFPFPAKYPIHYVIHTNAYITRMYFSEFCTTSTCFTPYSAVHTTSF